MNAKQAKQISLISILEQLKAKKYKETRRDIWYYSPFRIEKTASFKVNRWKNIFYDFGEGKGGNVIDFIMLYFHCDFTEALHIIRDRFNSFSFDQQNHFEIDADERKKENWKIRKIKPVDHPALISYLETRKFYKQRKFLKEIHYTVNKKFYFGIGFQNDSDGWEIRNKYVKLCLGKKDKTTILNGSSTIRIFEGFSDFLSFVEMNQMLKLGNSDVVVLNSISLVERIQNSLKHYEKIELFFDNDSGGNSATEILLKEYGRKVEDCRLLYPRHKDLNDFFVKK